VIRSFRDSEAEKLFNDQSSKRLNAIERPARRRLQALDAAESLADLKGIPGNRLEALRGDRKGQHSIRINDQFRVCFVWTEKGAEDVEIVDYH
jgi:toxin HigB-1